MERVRLWFRMDKKHRSAVFGLQKGQVAIDCGANIGVVTRAMASNGATVHALEPNPYAFKVLQEKCYMDKRIHLLPVAAGVKAGKTKLFLHECANQNQVVYSQGSSLISAKSNINPESFCEVESVDLSNFVMSIGHVDLLKMDVEGYEVELIPHLINTGAIDLIDLCLVELHDRKNPSLRKKTDALRNLIQEKNLSHKFDLDWH